MKVTFFNNLYSVILKKFKETFPYYELVNKAVPFNFYSFEVSKVLITVPIYEMQVNEWKAICK